MNPVVAQKRDIRNLDTGAPVTGQQAEIKPVAEIEQAKPAEATAGQGQDTRTTWETYAPTFLGGRSA